MDRPQPVSEELRKDLLNLVALNRYFGSHSLLRWFLHRWFADADTIRVLDLCTGAGDLPRLMVDWARAAGKTITVEAVDQNIATLEIAQSWSTEYPEIQYRQGDVLSYVPEAPAFDMVHCALALHHFSEADATAILKRSLQWPSRHVLIADLERSQLASVGIWLITQFVFTDPMTRNDARVSAGRAFTRAELRAIARAAGWPAIQEHGFPMFRQAIWTQS